MPGRGAVRDHRDRLRPRMRRVRPDLDVEHRGEAAESLGADAEPIHLLVELEAQLLVPVPRIPGGHQPAPIVGTVSSTQSTIESEGFSIANFDLFSEPAPFAATSTATVFPGTSSMWITAGVLSFVFLRPKTGSSTMDARSLLSGCR